MSPATPTPAAVRPVAPGGPSLRTKLAALAVLLALATLAYYAVFAGPTTVPVKAPSSAPSHLVAPAGAGEPGEGGGEGD